MKKLIVIVFCALLALSMLNRPVHYWLSSVFDEDPIMEETL